jgi:hypothetical protein
VDFIDFSPGALAQFVNMRAGRFNPMAITGLQPGDEKRPLAFAYAGAALAASSETQARSPKRSVDEGLKPLPAAPGPRELAASGATR